MIYRNLKYVFHKGVMICSYINFERHFVWKPKWIRITFSLETIREILIKDITVHFCTKFSDRGQFQSFKYFIFFHTSTGSILLALISFKPFITILKWEISEQRSGLTRVSKRVGSRPFFDYSRDEESLMRHYAWSMIFSQPDSPSRRISR